MASYCILCTTGSWKEPLGAGVAAILLGCFLVLLPELSLRLLVYIIGAIALIIGLALLAISWKISRMGALFFLVPLVVGLFALLAGALSFLNPGLTGSFYSVIFAAFCIIAGLGIGFTGLFQAPGIGRKMLFAAGGLILAAIGISVILYPTLSMAVIMKILGVFLLAAGAVSCAGAIFLWWRGRSRVRCIEGDVVRN